MSRIVNPMGLEVTRHEPTLQYAILSEDERIVGDATYIHVTYIPKSEVIICKGISEEVRLTPDEAEALVNALQAVLEWEDTE